MNHLAISQSFAENDQEILIEKLSNFYEKFGKSELEWTKKTLLKTLNMWIKNIKEGVKWITKWPQYLYKKFSKQYEEIKPIAEELSNVFENLDWERKSDEDFIDQYISISETKKSKYKDEIKQWYETLHQYLVPVKTRLKEMEEIIQKTKKLADKKPCW